MSQRVIVEKTLKIHQVFAAIADDTGMQTLQPSCQSSLEDFFVWFFIVFCFLMIGEKCNLPFGIFNLLQMTLDIFNSFHASKILLWRRIFFIAFRQHDIFMRHRDRDQVEHFQSVPLGKWTYFIAEFIS